MHAPNAVDLTAGGALAAIALIAGAFLPRLVRLSRYYPATRRPVLAWAGLTALVGLNAALHLAGAPWWTSLADEALGAAVAAIMLWRCRRPIASVLRRRPRAQAGPPAGTPLEVPRPESPAPGSGRSTWPSNPDGVSVTGVEQARRRYGRSL